MSVFDNLFENQHLNKALEIRSLTYQGKGNILDAKKELELACGEKDKYAWFFKARAWEYGGFGFGRTSKDVYDQVYGMAVDLGADFISFNTNNESLPWFSFSKDEKIPKVVEKVVRCDKRDVSYSWFGDEQYIYTMTKGTSSVLNEVQVAALNGNSDCALVVASYPGILTYDRLRYHVIARRRMWDFLHQQKTKDHTMYYIVGRFFTFEGWMFPVFTFSHDQRQRLRWIYQEVNTNCKQAVLCWLWLKLLVPDLVRVIGNMVWESREQDASKWIRTTFLLQDRIV